MLLPPCPGRCWNTGYWMLIRFSSSSHRAPSAWPLLDEVFDALAEFRLEYSLKSREAYLLTINEKHRYDPREVTIFKRLLQRELPEPVRTEIVRRLFAEHVTEDETAFACELYMTEDQIACLARRGMHVGSHGYAHAWLNHLAPESQIIEVDRSLEFLQRFGIRQRRMDDLLPVWRF